MNEIDDLINAGAGAIAEVEKQISNIRDRIAEQRKRPEKPVNYFLQTKVRKTAGLGRVIGGTIGAAFFILLALLLLIFGSAFGLDGFLITAVIAIAGAAGFGILIKQGIDINRLYKLYSSCAEIAMDSEYLSIEETAPRLGVSSNTLRKSFIRMIREHLLIHAWMDEEQTTLILTDEAYEMYQKSMEQKRLRELRESQKAELRDDLFSDVPDGLQDEIERGESFLRHIQEAKSSLGYSDIMSEKLNRLESVTEQILKKAKQQPDSSRMLRRFMNYYLPTTEKLIDAYVELEVPSLSEGNISKTRREILDVMDTICNAFETLCDQMYTDTATDISADIYVMKTLFKEDGLSDS